MTCYNVVTYTAKLYNHVIPNKGTQVIDSPAATFEGSWYREIDMVNSYNSNKVESLKAKRYTLQSSNPMHPASFNCALEIVNGIEEKGRKVMAFILWSIDRFLPLRIYGPTPGLISDPWHFNSQIKFLILLTVKHAILIMLVQRI